MLAHKKMGVFARKALAEARRFGQKTIGENARQFGRKITSAAQSRGGQIQDITGKLAPHAELMGMDGLSKGLRAIGNTAGEVAHVARLLDQNRPREAVDKVLNLFGK